MRMPAELGAVASSSAAPAVVRLGFERLLEGEADWAEQLRVDGQLAFVVASVMAASRSLGRLILADATALEVLAGVAR